MRNLAQAEFLADLFVHRLNQFILVFQFGVGACDRNHDFRIRFFAVFDQFGSGFENRPHLHFRHFRIRYAKTHAAMPHHGVAFVQALSAFIEFFGVNTKAFREFVAFSLLLRHEFVQRRVNRADCDREAVHRLQCAFDVVLHVWEEFVKGGAAFCDGFGGDHFAEDEQRIFRAFAIEHVFDAEQANPFCAEFDGFGGIIRRVGVGADFQAAELIA
ncbi:hypothetical protein U14_01265 [Candidatus Moduliflexus flocculans]|uniref:Uncharacterized protein n=1 Tax=Candidatus Moduliflexus flocculans TaxID=1499966 RepID=A0A0S6VRM9_9BACT|nr:hypothetical protein U14_01265 [Candidatus Moduliflexus flocculans]